MSINRVNISGNLTRDSELRSTASGNPVLQWGVAVNERRKNSKTGEWEDYPNFVDCTMFGTRAQKIAPYLRKGTKVAIDGRLRWSQWERDGQKRSKLEVIVDEIEFLSRSESQGQPQQVSAYQPQPIAPQTAAQPAQAMNQPQPMQTQMQGMPAPVVVNASVYDEDIPF